MTRPWWEDPARRAVVEAAVAEAEARTAAEVVVAVAPWASRYRAEALALASAAAMLLLLAFVGVPYDLPPGLALATVAATLPAGVRLLAGTAYPARLAGAARRHHLVTRAARLAFHDLALTGTRDRTGVLVFLAAGEGELVVIPDVGVARAGAALAVQQLGERRQPTPATPEHLAELVRAVGAALEGPLPRPEDDTDELPNALQVLSPDD